MIREQDIELDNADTALDISIVMPCLNEAKTIVQCIQEANEFFEKSGTVFFGVVRALKKIICGGNGKMEHWEIFEMAVEISVGVMGPHKNFFRIKNCV